MLDTDRQFKLHCYILSKSKKNILTQNIYILKNSLQYFCLMQQVIKQIAEKGLQIMFYFRDYSLPLKGTRRNRFKGTDDNCPYTYMSNTWPVRCNTINLSIISPSLLSFKAIMPKSECNKIV